MHPVLLKLGPLTFHTYGVLLAVVVLAGLWLVQRRGTAAGLDGDALWNLGVYAVLSAMLVAKVWLVLADWEYYSQHVSEIFSLNTLQSAGTFYGGFLGGVGVLFFGAWRLKIPFIRVLDVCAPSLMLGAAVGRIGCFAAGCCWGKPTEVAWGVTFTDPYAHQLVGTPLGVALHPTQLYDSAAALIIFLILLWLTPRQRFTGQIFATLGLLYGAARLTTEFFRNDPGRTLLFDGAFSLMQVVSVGLILLGTILYLRGLRAPESAAK
ncbi:MAG TPA: prolipoprotein diacylglyceryl transferase [Candidatus Nitrosotenuis sp.]|nr:prolipoprotein diacylglyceryl transferase [Candidatus Nitrosotenuis sp.]